MSLAPTPLSLDAKLVRFDAFSNEAVDDLISWLDNHRDDLVAIAKARHILGHYRFQDRNYFEYDEGDLLAEAGEELADAIAYTARRLWLEARAK